MEPFHGPRKPEPRSLASETSRIEGASLGISPDLRRYHEIVKGRIREDLQRYITDDDIISQHGSDMISIPIKDVSTPRFEFGSDQKGVGEGEGDEGSGDSKRPTKPGKAGQDQGDKQRGHTISIDELADILGETLELPRITPRPTSGLEQAVPRYDSISRRGPLALRDLKRTYLEALKRTIAEQAYDPNDPIVVPTREDFRYKSARLTPRPKTNAVILYIMDVSGSMGDLEKSLARNTAFWTDAWIGKNYEGAEKCYIVHDTTAELVDRDAFFSIRSSGGTVISSAYELARDEIKSRYRPDEWNIYILHFSDGENLSSLDNKKALSILKSELLPFTNLFGFVEVGDRNTGDFKEFLEEELTEQESVVLSSLPSHDDVIGTIKELLGTGR
ncbi:MAG: DUF444 family protein [Pseudomonadota bacterium]|jgi:uncharacterized sporulation protein YeaH/YhbH (DUF444 family)